MSEPIGRLVAEGAVIPPGVSVQDGKTRSAHEREMATLNAEIFQLAREHQPMTIRQLYCLGTGRL